MSDVNTRIVTCLYHHHYESEIGGRNWPVWYYRWTLTNILSMGLPVTIFCNSAKESIGEIHKIIDYYKTNNAPDINVEIIHHEIPYKIKKIRKIEKTMKTNKKMKNKRIFKINKNDLYFLRTK